MIVLPAHLSMSLNSVNTAPNTVSVSNPWQSTTTERRSMRPPNLRSKALMLTALTPSLSATTSSLLRPVLSSSRDLVTSTTVVIQPLFQLLLLASLMRLLRSSLLVPLPLTRLTGSLLVLSLVSRTRVSAVHAGPSPLLVPWKVLTSLLLVNLFLFLSSNLLIALAI